MACHWFTTDFFTYKLAHDRHLTVKRWNTDELWRYQVFCSYEEFQELDSRGVDGLGHSGLRQ